MKMIDYEIDRDGIATISWNMPDRSMNVLNLESNQAFADAVKKACEDETVKGVIVTSGKRDFLAGGDLEQLLETTYKSARQVFDDMGGVQKVYRDMETSGKPFVAALNGTALGGGFEIALACHHRIAADNPRARFGLPEVRVGLQPGAGGTQRLPRLIGLQPALELLLTGKSLDPQKALEKGLVHAVVPADELLTSAKKWLLESADPVQPWDAKGYRIPGGGPVTPKNIMTMLGSVAMTHDKVGDNMPAPRAILSSVYEGLIVPFDTSLEVESRYFTYLVTGSKVARNIIRTVFVNKGKAEKLARRPKDIAKTDPKKIGILGAGMMGAGIAYRAAKAGIETILIDRDIEAARRGKGYSAGLLEKAVTRKQMTVEQRDEVLALIIPATDYALLENADLVVETVFEDRTIKADVTQKTEAVIPAGSVFASNTSTLPITGLAEASARPENFIGLHYFSPVDKMPLVEVIRGEKTSDETLAKALDFVQKTKMTPIVVNDSRGFYTSRVFSSYTFEGMAMLAEGINPALIESAGKMTGMPMPPLALTDEVTIELGCHVLDQAKQDLGENYKPVAGEQVAYWMVGQDRIGRKTGKGFYNYSEDNHRTGLWEGLAGQYSLAKQQPDVQELIDRFLIVQALDTVRCLEEGVLTCIEDADVGAILGWGFAPWSGGPLSYIDMRGAAEVVKSADTMADAYPGGERFRPPETLRSMAQEEGKFYTL